MFPILLAGGNTPVGNMRNDTDPISLFFHKSEMLIKHKGTVKNPLPPRSYYVIYLERVLWKIDLQILDIKCDNYCDIRGEKGGMKPERLSSGQESRRKKAPQDSAAWIASKTKLIMLNQNREVA